MRLSTRLTVVFSAGAIVALAATASVQSWLLARQTRIHASADAQAIVEELTRALEMTQDDLDRTHTALASIAEREGRPGLMRSVPSAVPSYLLAPDGSVLATGGAVTEALRAWVEEWATSPRPKRVRGVVRTPLGPRFFAATVLEPVGDRLVQFAPLAIDGLRQGRLGVHIELVPALDGAIGEYERTHFERLFRGAERVSNVADDAVTIYLRLVDCDGAPTYVARVRAERLGGSLQRAWLGDTLAWMGVLALSGALLVRWFLRASVVEPLDALRQHALRIGRTDHGRVEIRLARTDEFGDLAQALNEMLRTLERTRKELADSARHVGMADISKGVVHSMGNVLTSVNVSAHFIAEELRHTGVGDLRLLIDELRNHQHDIGSYLTEDPNGRHLLSFLDAMTASLEDFQTRCTVELDQVERGLGHVVQLARSLDRYTVAGAVSEPVDVKAAIDAALEIACLSHGGAREVEIVRELQAVPQPVTDRQKLTTILTHLFTNALDSLLSAPLAHKRLEVAAYEAGHGRLVIEITDTGAGIAPEHLDSIFTAGFTTRAGAAGEGLHTAANLCRELGISIGTMSEGLGSGATFKLRVPLELPKDELPAAEEPPSILPSISGGGPQFDRRKRPSSRT